MKIEEERGEKGEGRQKERDSQLSRDLELNRSIPSISDPMNQSQSPTKKNEKETLFSTLSAMSVLTPARDRRLREREDRFPTSLAPPALSNRDWRMSTLSISLSNCL